MKRKIKNKSINLDMPCIHSGIQISARVAVVLHDIPIAIEKPGIGIKKKGRKQAPCRYK